MTNFTSRRVKIVQNGFDLQVIFKSSLICFLSVNIALALPNHSATLVLSFKSTGTSTISPLKTAVKYLNFLSIRNF